MLKSSIDEQRIKVLKFISWHKDWVSKDWIKIFLEKNKILEEWLSPNKKKQIAKYSYTSKKRKENWSSMILKQISSESHRLI